MGLYGYIWATSGRTQILLALLSVFIFLLDLVPLELQRRIVNDAIGQKAVAELLWLCGAYAVTALVQGLAKLTWYVYRNSVGEATSLRQLRALGVRISIDDFGTGYSSLASLKDLSVDELKIDQSFVLAMATDASSRAITPP